MLSTEEQAILDIAGAQWRQAGHQAAAISERLGMTPTRYYQRLNHLLDREDALVHDPILVHRLRRLRTRHH
ncbi:DUF3263 domain-containing protein [Gordonia caeni]|uniref:DUF3263 domain-containing protein n=1 Tax=Gordonia caeni TaxID=1007097 RepID=A0ABP7PB66_9ACTN